MAEPTTHTLDVPGATLAYDLREPDTRATNARCSFSARRWARRASSSWSVTSPTAR